MIPDALMEMSDISLSGKTVTLLGFSGMGFQAAQAIRDVSGGKMIVVENDLNLALSAFLNGFEVKSFESALPISDFIILVKEQRIKLETMQKAKTNCIFASLEEAPQVVNIDVESLQQFPGIQCCVAKPELLSYTFPKTG